MRRVSATRVYASKEKDLWEQIKHPVKLVCSLLKDGGDDFISLFQYCYPNLWASIEKFHAEMSQWNTVRTKKYLSPVYEYATSSEFLLVKVNEFRARSKFEIDSTRDEEKRLATIEALHNSSDAKYVKNTIKEKVRERLKQKVPPSYAKSHISIYYDWRKLHPDDIDTRYLIIHELAKYKCRETIRFLTGLVRCEKNLPLQHYAWECLNALGITGVHKGRRPGHKKASHLKTFIPITSPQDLLHAIYNSPLEQMKHYDLFLSHSYKDSSELISLKDDLNKLGLNVYVDWVNDKDELLRNKTCAETAVVITERMKRCTAILYVHTASSLLSRWTPWELGFAYANGIPIIVYRPEPDVEEPEYLQLYDNVVKEEEFYYVIVEGKKVALVDYIKKDNIKNHNG